MERCTNSFPDVKVLWVLELGSLQKSFEIRDNRLIDHNEMIEDFAGRKGVGHG